jgi:ABC-2 type transport system permease protein
MNAQRLWAVVVMEWTQAFAGWPVKIITALPPLIVLLGLLFQPRAGHLQVITDVLSIQMEGASLYADPSNWNRTGDFYLVVFTVLPLFSVVKIAGAGLLNDKASRSLEPLLATPLTGGELFSGKVLAAVAPAVLGSWASFLVFAATLAHLGVATTAIFGPFKGSIWLLAVFVIGPLLALFQALFTLWVCAQTGGARLAENLANAMVGLLSAAILTALLYWSYNFYVYQRQLIGPVLLLQVAAGLVVLVALGFWACLKQFQRETILFKWK